MFRGLTKIHPMKATMQTFKVTYRIYDRKKRNIPFFVSIIYKPAAHNFVKKSLHHSFFLRVLQNFSKQPFFRIPLGDYFWRKQLSCHDITHLFNFSIAHFGHCSLSCLFDSWCWFWFYYLHRLSVGPYTLI